MRVLLINPPIKNIIRLEMPLFVREMEGPFPPLGLMYIASYLKKHEGCEVRILDSVAEEKDYKEIEKYIQGFRPDIVGVTVHTHNLIDVIMVVDMIKRIDRGIYVCLGGPHVNIFPQKSINIPSADFVVQGEGEVTFTELVRFLKCNGDLNKVKGLLFKQNGKCVNTGPREDRGETLPRSLRSTRA